MTNKARLAIILLVAILVATIIASTQTISRLGYNDGTGILVAGNGTGQPFYIAVYVDTIGYRLYVLVGVNGSFIEFGTLPAWYPMG